MQGSPCRPILVWSKGGWQGVPVQACDVLLEGLVLLEHGSGPLQVLLKLSLLPPPATLLRSTARHFLHSVLSVYRLSRTARGQQCRPVSRPGSRDARPMQGMRGGRSNACWVMQCCGSNGRTREWRLVSCCCRCSRDWRSLSASAFAAATAPLSCSARCLSCEQEDSASVPAYRQREASCGLPPLITEH